MEQVSASGVVIDSAEKTPTLPPDASDVTLTPAEETAALRDALRLKRHKVSLERNRTMEKIRMLEQSIQGPDTPSKLWMEIHRRGTSMAGIEQWDDPFGIPAHGYAIYQALCSYFTRDEAGLLHYHLNPNKGLLVYGNIGCGKTVMMKLFARNVLQSYQVVRCSQIELEYKGKDQAEATINRYSAMSPNSYLSNYYNQAELGQCFDDFGAEKEGNNYGDRRDVMIDILESRYANPLCRGPKTHVTTNASLQQIESRYGPRVLDRMKQMFNLIDFPEDALSMRH